MSKFWLIKSEFSGFSIIDIYILVLKMDLKIIEI